MTKIAIIPGDGVGVEVTAEALKAIRAASEVFSLRFEYESLPWSASYYLRTGVTVPADGYVLLRSFDAVLMGAFGDPRVPDHRHARDILLGTRAELDLYVNQRPVRLMDARLCPLKDRSPADVNFVVFRENTEGVYAGIGGRVHAGTDREVGVQEDINTYAGVSRIMRHAFEYARARRLPRLCMADKSNAMPEAHGVWQRVFHELAPQFPEIAARHLYIDALALALVQDPSQFDVIVTNNLFGDIITDLGAALQGGLGVAASANLHPGRTSMFEPVHGSAPQLAGRNLANPIGAILSAALMLEVLGHGEAAAAVERAVNASVRAGVGTPDIGGLLGTREAGDWITRQILEARG